VIGVDELGPVTPRIFPPASGWSPDGHRIKAPLEYGRGSDKAWIYGALTPKDGQEFTMSARSRNSDNYCQFLAQIEQAHPAGTLFIITDNPLQSYQPQNADMVSVSSAYSARFHPQRGCLVELTRRLVALAAP